MKTLIVLLIMVILNGCALNTPPYGGEDEAWWTRQVIEQNHTQVANGARGYCPARDWECAWERYDKYGIKLGGTTGNFDAQRMKEDGQGKAIERVYRERKATLINDCINGGAYGCGVPTGD